MGMIIEKVEQWSAWLQLHDPTTRTLTLVHAVCLLLRRLLYLKAHPSNGRCPLSTYSDLSHGRGNAQGQGHLTCPVFSHKLVQPCPYVCHVASARGISKTSMEHSLSCIGSRLSSGAAMAPDR